MEELVKWVVFVIYGGLYWIAMAAGVLMMVVVVAAIWDTLWRR